MRTARAALIRRHADQFVTGGTTGAAFGAIGANTLDGLFLLHLFVNRLFHGHGLREHATFGSFAGNRNLLFHRLVSANAGFRRGVFVVATAEKTAAR